MELQTVAVYIILGLAVLFLLRKFVFKSKKDNGCDKGCDC
jgi:hypothetical protein